MFEKHRKSLGNKRNDIPKHYIDEITNIYAEFKENEVGKIFDTKDFGYSKIVVECPERDEKGKYIYYHCTNSKGLDKSKPSIREEKIEESFADFLKELSMPVSEFERLKEQVKDFVNQGNDYIEQKTAEMKHRIDVLNRRLSKLYDDRMDGVISDEFYFDKRDAWQKELDDTLFAFNKTASSNRTLIDRANLIIELSKDAYSLYLSQTPKEKADLMKLLTIELLFDGVNLLITPHSAFSNLLNCLKSHKMERTVQ